ncbi:3-deoxy-D-manno-octulosonic acid transferase, partial [bacterium]|nr:3-deoxy-D-manno-octulosonic acid transferase [bacterium]
MRKHKIPWLWYWSPLSYVFLILVAPYYLYRMWTTEKYREGLRQRLGRYRPDEIENWQNRRFIWVHTVSVGELQAARPLLRRLKETYPDRDLFITTVTQTGQELARSLDEVDAC